MLKIQNLRKKYLKFLYKGYSFVHQNGDLKISFDFVVPPDIAFHPKVVIKNVSKIDLERVGESVLKNLVFQLGLVEMVSYWKATCSPKIVIEAGYLSKQQIMWWKDLILNGMGEFFYKNKIDFTKPNFLTISSSVLRNLVSKKETKFLAPDRLSKRILLPIGGGKDAIVTLELLKKLPHRAFVLNPKQEHKAILKIAGEKNTIIVERVIDPKLLELNKKGYLNGHTPFSAYLAFLSVFAGVLFNYKYIALSNERSSNEGNIKYLGKVINHQYSKSFDFEKKFREYSKKYLAKNIEYFSFLRPFYELQIAKIFSNYPKYFPAFLSCNEANKTYSGIKPTGLPAVVPTKGGTKAGKWCGKCSKCLFVWLALYPFVEEKQLVSIFKKNLFQDKTLVPLLNELTGKRKFKPFECVGTIKESRAALSLCRQKQRGELQKYPRILQSWNAKNFVPGKFFALLKQGIS